MNNASPDIKPPVSILPYILIMLSCFVLAGMDATAKYLAMSQVPVLLIIWARYLLQSGITFVVLSARLRSLRFLVAKRPGLQFFRACTLFCATLMFYNALKYLSLAECTSIIFLSPIIVTILSGIFLHEAIGLHRWIALGIAFIGVMVVVRPGSGIFGLTALLPLGAAFFTALYFVMTRVLSNKDHPAVTAFYSTAVGAVILSLVTPYIWIPMAADTWLILMFAGVLGALGHGLIVMSYTVAEASALAPFTYLQLVAAILWGYLFFDDLPNTWTLLGAALIVGAGIYVWYSEYERKKIPAV